MYQVLVIYFKVITVSQMFTVTFSLPLMGMWVFGLGEGQQSPNCHCISCATLAQLYVILRSTFYNFANYNLRT